MDKNSKIYVAGSTGLVGSAIVRKLEAEGFRNIIEKSHSELDLLRQDDVEKFFSLEKPEYVFLAAARVGGIAANMESPAQFLYENIQIESNIIHCSYKNNVKKLLFLASSCIYPRLSPQPMKEDYLLDGKVEPTNEGYAIAKIVGIKLCEMYNKQYGTNYISIMPSNVYGIGDNFDPIRSHVVAALISKIHKAKINKEPQISIWGTGKARRELLFVDDLADACLFFMDTKQEVKSFINIGSGSDISIAGFAELLKNIIGYVGDIVFDPSKPDGMPQKLLDVSLAKTYGWEYNTELIEGLNITYQWYLNNYDNNSELVTPKTDII